jgi:hypothetical protein
MPRRRTCARSSSDGSGLRCGWIRFLPSLLGRGLPGGRRRGRGFRRGFLNQVQVTATVAAQLNVHPAHQHGDRSDRHSHVAGRTYLVPEQRHGFLVPRPHAVVMGDNRLGDLGPQLGDQFFISGSEAFAAHFQFLQRQKIGDDFAHGVDYGGTPLAMQPFGKAVGKARAREFGVNPSFPEEGPQVDSLPAA